MKKAIFSNTDLFSFPRGGIFPFLFALVKLIITITTFSLENNSKNTFRWTKNIKQFLGLMKDLKFLVNCLYKAVEFK